MSSETGATNLDETATTATQLALQIVKSGFRFVVNENDVQRAMQEYQRRFNQRHGSVKILGMVEPVPLNQVYTAVQVIPPTYLSRFSSVEGLEQSFRASGSRRLFIHGERTRDGIEVANERQYLTVLGAPGAGKSTFLRKLAMEALLPRRTWSAQLLALFRPGTTWSDYKHDCLPVFLELRRLRTSAFDLHSLLEQEFQVCGFPSYAKFVTSALKQGKLLLLLDGLDEVGTGDLERIITTVQDFVDRYSECRYVISCRTAFYKAFFHSFADVVLSDMDETQVRTVIDKWFARRPQDVSNKAGAELWRAVQAQPGTLELVRTPLLLAFVCLVFEATQRLPANRSQLYRKAVDILLERWNAEKLVHHDRIYEDLTPEIELEMLTDIAADAYENDRLFFSQQELVSKIDVFLRTQLGAPKRLTGAQILTAIEIQQGLLIERAPDVYSFSHLTIQEFLAAKAFTSQDGMPRLVQDHLFDERWREVFLLLAGQVRADGLLQLMADQLSSAVRANTSLHALLRWAAHVASFAWQRRGEDGAADRASAVALAAAVALTSASDRELRRAISLMFTRASELARMCDPGTNLTLHVALDSATELKAASATPSALKDAQRRSIADIVAGLESLRHFRHDNEALRRELELLADEPSRVVPQSHRAARAVSRALNVPNEWLDIDQLRAQNAAKYLYAATLVVSCKAAALTVSAPAWQFVADRLCRSPAGHAESH